MSRRLPFVPLLLLVLAVVACSDNDTKLKVTGLEPERGDVEGGTYVRIKGNAFLANGQPRSAKVYFGSRQGTVVRFASDKELIVEAPGGKPNEVVDVLIIFEGAGELKIPKGFTFVEKNNAPAQVQDLNTDKNGDKKK
jgi:hypothetical protein